MNFKTEIIEIVRNYSMMFAHNLSSIRLTQVNNTNNPWVSEEAFSKHFGYDEKDTRKLFAFLHEVSLQQNYFQTTLQNLCQKYQMDPSTTTFKETMESVLLMIPQFCGKFIGKYYHTIPFNNIEPKQIEQISIIMNQYCKILNLNPDTVMYQFGKRLGLAIDSEVNPLSKTTAFLCLFKHFSEKKDNPMNLPRPIVKMILDATNETQEEMKFGHI